MLGRVESKECTTMLGRVESIEYTLNSPFGNQWTTIDGNRYMTWWDAATLPVRTGVMVEYEVSPETLRVGNSYT